MLPACEPVQIFSLGVCLYELFSKAIQAADLSYTGASPLPAARAVYQYRWVVRC